MTGQGRDILIGIDAGTSVIKSVAFLLDGTQVAMASVPNRYTSRADGAAFQSQSKTWADCAQTLRDLADKVPGLAARTAALAVTGQGDGTWLVGKDNQPVTDGWLWLDARSSATAIRLRQSEPPARFESTGTALNACQMGVQLAHMDTTQPDMLDAAEVALHCKDWLYLNLTGVRATDPSEANFTFGNYLTRTYNDTVIASLGLEHRRALLPEIVDGAGQTHGLTAEAARQTGLREGTPVSLAYVDVVCTGLGAGLYTPEAATGGGSGQTERRAFGVYHGVAGAGDGRADSDQHGFDLEYRLAAGAWRRPDDRNGRHGQSRQSGCPDRRLVGAHAAGRGDLPSIYLGSR
jgi:erythritol kinase